MSSNPTVSQIDHQTETAEARWQALVARIRQDEAADYVCDQLRAELMTDGAALCYQLSHLCEHPPSYWEIDEISALMSTIEAAALGKALVRAMAYALCQYMCDLSRQG